VESGIFNNSVIYQQLPGVARHALLLTLFRHKGRQQHGTLQDICWNWETFSLSGSAVG